VQILNCSGYFADRPFEALDATGYFDQGSVRPGRRPKLLGLARME
jgi:hypothetical protein